MNNAIMNAAIWFAAMAHQGQQRKYTGEPYINHPKDVMTVLLDQVSDVTDAMLVAAILHDVVEDTDFTLEEIKKLFGAKVAKLVDELTHKEDRRENRRTRKQKEAIRLGTISPEAQTIKYADILCNAQDISEHDPDFARVWKAEKRAALMEMNKGHAGLRNSAWLACVTPCKIKCNCVEVTPEEAEAMVGG